MAHWIFAWPSRQQAKSPTRTWYEKLLDVSCGTGHNLKCRFLRNIIDSEMFQGPSAAGVLFRPALELSTGISVLVELPFLPHTFINYSSNQVCTIRFRREYYRSHVSWGSRIVLSRSFFLEHGNFYWDQCGCSTIYFVSPRTPMGF